MAVTTIAGSIGFDGDRYSVREFEYYYSGSTISPVVRALSRDPYSVTSIVEKDRVTGSARNNRRLWLGAPAQGRGDNRLIRPRD